MSTLKYKEKTSRFSDEKLSEFLIEFKRHKESCELRFTEIDDLMRDLIEMQAKNTETIGKLAEETSAIVQLHRDIQGAARVGSSIQKILVSVVKWGVLGAGAISAVALLASDIFRALG